ncbi:hypothetical protein BpHYR1_049702, partial [Brachionus plicatilis]
QGDANQGNKGSANPTSTTTSSPPSSEEPSSLRFRPPTLAPQSGTIIEVDAYFAPPTEIFKGV